MLKRVILLILVFGLSSCSWFVNKNNINVVKVKTGLMWKKCPEGLSGQNCDEGKAKKLTWAESLNQYGSGYTSSEGYDDWRMPTRSEFKTLMQCNNGKLPRFLGTCDQKNVAINRNLFPRVDSYPHYWTGSEHIIFSTALNSSAWVASFNNGFIYSAYKSSRQYIRLVRGDRSHFSYPEDAEYNNNRHIGPFCCTGRTLTVQNGSKHNLGYVYFFGWSGQALNTRSGAVFPNIEILVAGVKSKKDASMVKTRIVIPAKEEILKKRFKVDVGCISYTFSHIKARLIPFKGSLFFKGMPKRLEIDVSTEQCH